MRNRWRRSLRKLVYRDSSAGLPSEPGLVPDSLDVTWSNANVPTNVVASHIDVPVASMGAVRPAASIYRGANGHFRPHGTEDYIRGDDRYANRLHADVGSRIGSTRH